VLNSKVIDQWQEKVRHNNDKSALVLSVCGPSGAGKTTVAKALAKIYPAFIETTAGNPYLIDLLKGKSDFKAFKNQNWFLSRVGRHISRAKLDSPLILDQDPSAIVMVYSRVFMEDGKLTEKEFDFFLKKLLIIEKNLQDWRAPRTVLFLDAPADVLRQRNLKKWGASNTPPIIWFERLRAHFVKLFTCFPSAISASTNNLSPEEVINRAKSLIERRCERKLL